MKRTYSKEYKIKACQLVVEDGIKAMAMFSRDSGAMAWNRLAQQKKSIDTFCPAKELHRFVPPSKGRDEQRRS